MNDSSFCETLDFLVEQENIVDNISSITRDIDDYIIQFQNKQEYNQVVCKCGRTETLQMLSSDESIFSTISSSVKDFVNWIIQKLKEIWSLIKKYLGLWKRPSILKSSIITKGDLEEIVDSIPKRDIIVPFPLYEIYTAVVEASKYFSGYVATSINKVYSDLTTATENLNGCVWKIDPTSTNLKDLYAMLYITADVRNRAIEYLETTEQVLNQFLSKTSVTMTPEELVNQYTTIRNGYVNLPNIVLKGRTPSECLKEIVDILNRYILFTSVLGKLLTPFIEKATTLYHQGGIPIHVKVPFDQDLAAHLKHMYKTNVTMRWCTVTNQDPETWNYIGDCPITNRICAWCYTNNDIYAVDVYVNATKIIKMEKSFLEKLSSIFDNTVAIELLCHIVHESCHLKDAQNHIPFDDKSKDHETREHEIRASNAEAQYKKNIPRAHITWAKDLLKRIDREIQLKSKM